MSEVQELHVINRLPDYVLDILTDAEITQVAEHLAGCQYCREELQQLKQVADEIPLALVQTAPPARVKICPDGFNPGTENKTSPCQPTYLLAETG